MYVEKLPWKWTAFCVAVYLVMVGRLGVDALPEDLGLWLGVSAAFLLVLVPCVAVPLSKRIYHRIRVDPAAGVLRVGRERIALADVDPRSVQDARVPGRPDALQQGQPRLVGGGWAVPMGMDSVTITTRQGQALTIATHDRGALLEALRRATAAGG
ncbi:hypothetical protein [Streptomyces lavendofoliae]|uniref:hypothetical protein n=1 Tax=Streptomyces lavendofoliae TaxID=67314 RepID=UPI003D8CC16C